MDPITLMFFGTVFGYVLPYMVKIIIYFFQRTKKTSICGKWNVYICYNSKSGTISINKMEAQISKAAFFEYKMIAFDSMCCFKGYGYTEYTDLCVDMNCSDMGVNGNTHHRYNLSKILTKKMFWNVVINK